MVHVPVLVTQINIHEKEHSLRIINPAVVCVMPHTIRFYLSNFLFCTWFIFVATYNLCAVSLYHLLKTGLYVLLVQWWRNFPFLVEEVIFEDMDLRVEFDKGCGANSIGCINDQI